MKKLIASIMMIALVLSFTACSQKGEEVIEVVVPGTPSIATPTDTPAATPVPTSNVPAYVSPYTQKIADARAKNSDTVGWFAISGTNIEYPIMYGDNWYYANHDLNKKEITSGSIYSHFSDAYYASFLSQTNINLKQNIVITGHNSRVSGTMFHQLHHIQEVNLGKTKCAYAKCTSAVLDPNVLPNFSTPEGRTWDISILGIDAQWEVWAMYEVDEKEPESTLYYNTWFPSDKKYYPENQKEIQDWIDKQVSRSQYDFNAQVGVTDQFLTIYTCGDNHDSDTAQSRLYFFLKQVNPAPTAATATNQ